MLVRRLAQETDDSFDGIMAKVAALYPGSSPSKITKLVEDARKPGAQPWNQPKKGGKMVFIRELLTRGGLTKAEIVEKFQKEFSDVSEQTAKNSVNWIASQLGNKSRHLKEANQQKAPEVSSRPQPDETTDDSPLAEWLKKARIARGFSIAELANRSGVTHASIYRIEDGVTRNLRETTRVKLEKALGSAMPAEAANEVAQESQVPGLGRFEDFNPYADEERPTGPGIYVLYDISERPVYVGEGSNVRARIIDHEEKFWFKRPIIESASWIRIEDVTLRKQIETLLIKFLKSNAIINKQHVER